MSFAYLVTFFLLTDSARNGRREGEREREKDFFKGARRLSECQDTQSLKKEGLPSGKAWEKMHQQSTYFRKLLGFSWLCLKLGYYLHLQLGRLCHTSTALLATLPLPLDFFFSSCFFSSVCACVIAKGRRRRQQMFSSSPLEGRERGRRRRISMSGRRQCSPRKGRGRGGVKVGGEVLPRLK